MIKPINTKRLETIKKFLIYNFLRFLGYLIKKRETIWIFGEHSGLSFSGNPKYLYLYVKDHHPEIRSIWFTKSERIYQEIEKIGGETYLFDSIKALYFGLIAKVYIFSHSLYDINNYSIRKSKLVNLWHGMPIKNTTRVNELLKEKVGSFRFKKQRIIQDLVSWDPKSKYDLLLSTSETTKITLKKMFHSTNNIVITGEPKNDIFFNGIKKQELLNKLNLSQFEDYKVVTYMPTFRDKPTNYINTFNFSETEMKDFNKILFLNKWHPADASLKMSEEMDSPNLVYISNQDIYTQEIMFLTDILITDYSSCFVDFLLLNRPIIFFAYDFKEYSEYRGFFYDYSNIVPGPIVYTMNELLLVLKEYIHNPEKDKDKREKTRTIFHKYKDGRFSQNVYKEIIELLKTGADN